MEQKLINNSYRLTCLLFLVTSGLFLLLSNPTPVYATISEVTASGAQTLDQTSYTAIDTMSITPGAGSYLAIFTMQVLYNASPGSNVLRVSIYANGSAETESERELGSSSSLNSAVWTVMTHAYVTVGAGQAIDARYQITTGASWTAQDRSLTLIPVDSGDVTEVTAVSNTTTASGSYGQLDSMAIA